MESFYYDNQHMLDDMRTSDLRNMLIQKLGVSSSLVSRVIDKKELVQLMKNVLLDRIQKRSNEQFQSHIYRVATMALIVFIIYLCRGPLKSMGSQMVRSLKSTNYILIRKVKLIIYNMRKHELIGAAFLLISLMLECAMCYIQLCTLLSWFISTDHQLRRYMLPIISCPISSNAIISATNYNNIRSQMSNHGISSSFGGVSVDVGPMITIAIMRWLINTCDNYSASRIHHFVHAHHQKDAHSMNKHNTTTTTDKENYRTAFFGKTMSRKVDKEDRTDNVECKNLFRMISYEVSL